MESKNSIIFYSFKFQCFIPILCVQELYYVKMFSQSSAPPCKAARGCAEGSFYTLLAIADCWLPHDLFTRFVLVGVTKWTNWSAPRNIPMTYRWRQRQILLNKSRFGFLIRDAQILLVVLLCHYIVAHTIYFFIMPLSNFI